MTRKPNPLTIAVQRLESERSAPKAKPKAPSISTPIEPTSKRARRGEGDRPRSRQGKTFIAVYVNPDVHRQLKLYAVMNGRGIQECMLEAMDLFFEKHGLEVSAQAVDGD
ncbi:ribbon-helix-helix domain-containing protein [Methylobacterium isbiliense]|uniref:ribbon-helix-helix domain-containing protein n=1 Tax=Methylobacterium isbiliense TaxID=315478 RepID=UPI001EE2C464|nr:ribbon-helix-helix domain-containing protein [Methylobacterium isbiliense]MDN3627772.1 hypothetical protein [Methylobacterium isbiliense]